MDKEARKFLNPQGEKLVEILQASDEEIAEMVEKTEFEVMCGDEMVAAASGPREAALREALNYAIQYAPDGEVSIYEVTRTKIA